VGKLVEHLERKLGIFAESATSLTDPDVTASYRQICALEAECVVLTIMFLLATDKLFFRDLKKESYGAELLQAIGFVYVSKAKHFLATNQTLFGMGGWLHSVQGKYHVISET
jgi:hypothetical protein